MLLPSLIWRKLLTSLVKAIIAKISLLKSKIFHVKVERLFP